MNTDYNKNNDYESESVSEYYKYSSAISIWFTYVNQSSSWAKQKQNSIPHSEYLHDYEYEYYCIAVHMSGYKLVFPCNR